MTGGVVLHVDAFVPRIMTLALANAAEIRADHGAEVELVVNGPAVRLLRDGPGPLRDSIAAAMPALRISACAAALGDAGAAALIAGVAVVPSGAARLVALQRAGWAYIKP